jgi:hypothetical protein
MFRVRHVVLGALIVAGLGAGSAAAAPPAHEVPAPPPPAERPEAARVALQLLHGRVDGRRLRVELSCGRSGRLELSAAGRSLGGGSFACRGSRARLTVRLPAAVARRVAAGHGPKVTATANVGGWRTTFTLELARRVRPARAAVASGSIVNAVWCTRYGFQASVDTATHFGAGYGEQVWWRPIGWQYETQSWSTRTYIAGHGLGDNLWDTYYAVPDNDYFRGAFYANAQVRSQGLWTTRLGVWVRPAIQWYTRYTGYDWRWVSATTSNDYGENPATWCQVTY